MRCNKLMEVCALSGVSPNSPERGLRFALRDGDIFTEAELHECALPELIEAVGWALATEAYAEARKRGSSLPKSSKRAAPPGASPRREALLTELEARRITTRAWEMAEVG